MVDGELQVKGIITRADMNEHRLAHYWEEYGQQMQNEMSVDTLPPAIGYEPRLDPATIHRRRSASVQSNTTADTAESDIDVEILMNDLETSDSPNISIRKRIAP